ncbi:galactose-3-O-sulfotransferase-domain-containing protein [Cladochytrium replicatum]|nr:galactose-3-O-sulfotransferase-domain-containing protein [Cladochytrium replicatum]
MISLVWLVFMPESSSTVDTTIQLTSHNPPFTPDPTFHAPQIRLTFPKTPQNALTLPNPSQPPRQNRYIFIKTHKTGSTTLGSIFFRYGVKHRQKIFIPGRHYTDQMDFEHPKITSNLDSHIFLSHFGPMNRSWFREHPVQLNVAYMMQMYRRAVPGGMGITVLRDPHARFLSHYQYLIRPSHPHLSLADYARSRKVFFAPGVGYWSQNWNRQCQELGIRTVEDLNRFLAVEKDKYFSLILITELFDESLVLMRRMLGWERGDILYVKMLDSCADGHRWDNKAVECSKKFAKRVLTEPGYEETRDLVARANRLDMLLYKSVRMELERKLAAQGADFWEEVGEFKAKIKALKSQCASFSALNNPVQIKLVNWTQRVTSRNLIRLRNMVKEESEKPSVRGGDGGSGSAGNTESQLDHDIHWSDLSQHQYDSEQERADSSPNDIEEVSRVEYSTDHPNHNVIQPPQNSVQPMGISSNRNLPPLKLNSVGGELDATERNHVLARALKMFAQKLALQARDASAEDFQVESGYQSLNNDSGIPAHRYTAPNMARVERGQGSANAMDGLNENLRVGASVEVEVDEREDPGIDSMVSIPNAENPSDCDPDSESGGKESATDRPPDFRSRLRKRALVDIDASGENVDTRLPKEQQDTWTTQNLRLALTLRYFASRRNLRSQESLQQSRADLTHSQQTTEQSADSLRSDTMKMIPSDRASSVPVTTNDRLVSNSRDEPGLNKHEMRTQGEDPNEQHNVSASSDEPHPSSSDPHLVERRRKVKLALEELSKFDGTAETREEARRALTVDGMKVDPYPCFPYTVSDLHYEKLIRLSRGRVTYMPGLVPAEEDEIWQSFT